MRVLACKYELNFMEKLLKHWKNTKLLNIPILCSAVTETLCRKEYRYCESHSFDCPLPSYIACGEKDSAVNIIFTNIKCIFTNKKCMKQKTFTYFCSSSFLEQSIRLMFSAFNISTFL